MIKDLENKSFVSNRIKKQIISTICSNTINSFIIGGSKGLGKKNFIFKLCKFMLCHFELNDEISSEIFEVNQFCLDKTNINKSYYLFENNSHPDFFYLCKEENGDEKKIPIEKVRNLKSFFYKTFSVSKVKIAIIDTIEDLSLNSLNLLLKTIEELPQKSYIFIISNNPVNIIETIKSSAPSGINANHLCRRLSLIFEKMFSKYLIKPAPSTGPIKVPTPPRIVISTTSPEAVHCILCPCKRVHRNH